MFGKRWRERQKIKAVHDSDLDGLLESLGILEKIRKGYLKCNVCGGSISMENIQLIIPIKDGIGLCCDKLSCLQQLFLMSKESINV